MKAVGFDLGHTLIHYKGIPLSWQNLYRDALKEITEGCFCTPEEGMLQRGAEILTKYNTRVNPRLEEVHCDVILGEILQSWGLSINHLETAKERFFTYFQQNSEAFEDTLPILEMLREKGIKVGILTDVPYGMSSNFVNHDLRSIGEYIDLCLSSVDVGYRKPHEKGFLYLAKGLGVEPGDMIFVGDEEKDIVGANNTGIYSVLIDREYKLSGFGERVKIHSLYELQSLL